MRLLRVYIDGYRNLKNVEVDFDKDSLTTVVIGQNGSGKSNLIEAIVEVFRAWDLGEPEKLRFDYIIDFELAEGLSTLRSRGQKCPESEKSEFNTRLNSGDINNGPFHCYLHTRPKRINIDYAIEEEIVIEHTLSVGGISDLRHFPELVFGYYSGSERRLEALFDDHQAAYYKQIIKEEAKLDFEKARRDRRLFYCRPVHGALALLSQFAFPTDTVRKELAERLKIADFHSSLVHMKEPSWFNSDRWKRQRSSGMASQGRGRRTHDQLSEQASDIWGSIGPAGDCARALHGASFFPLTLAGNVVDDYRKKPRTESQLACFLRDGQALKSFKANYKTDQDMFAALEAMDISDLFREMIVWVTREGDESGDISFSDLSDGERQLLMVLGLIRVSRGKEALFLLDEPDTHLNPAWQLTYLELIKEWTEVAADEDKCQIIMTTHNPLTIAALEAREVRVMSADDDGNVSMAPPRIDPRGLGFAGVLTDIFGLSSSLDKPTQEKIDRRNELAREKELDPAMAKEFADIKEELRHLGFLYEERDKLYSEFLKQLDRVELADVDPLTPEELRAREEESREIVERLLKKS